MIGVMLVCSTLLAAQDADPTGPKAKGPAGVEVVAPGEALARYNELKEKTPETAAAQWKLALWCEQHGLKAEAVVHFTAVARLDPKRDAAWRKLGLKKHEGRWLTDEQIAEEKALKEDAKVWGPRLKKIHKDIHGGHGPAKQAEAQAALDAIVDPKAIPSVYAEFWAGGARDQEIAVQVLGQIDTPLSSKVLALMAVYGKSPAIRARATEMIRRRPDSDYLELLVSLMVDTLKYAVKPVGGPGSPGVLFVEGERFNARRLYAPPALPNLTPMPGDIITYDQFGMPVLTRFVVKGGPKVGVPGSKTEVYESDPGIKYSATEMLIESQRAVASSRAQLQADVAQVESINADRKAFNELVMAAATETTGKDRGRTAQEWRDALAAENKYARRPTRTPQKPTFTEVIPSAYNPTYAHVGTFVKVVQDS